MAAPRPAPSAVPSRRSTQSYPEQEPDEIIGEFRRGKEVGKGSFAAVYLAQHRKHKSYAAVKAVQMTKLTKKLKENLESEVKILKSLQHPHIVALFSCFDTPAYIYLVMEYCQLSDLSQFMKKRHSLAALPETADIFRKYPNPPAGGLHEVVARHFLKQIASALQYLRSRNLIHRDIKPQNLLLNPPPSFMAKQKPEDVPLTASEHSLVPAVGIDSLPMLKIADFGFARHLPSTSLAETLCGSPLYMAPEILRYEKYDARADLWSTGTVLHEMVVGKPPFRAQNHVDLLRRIERANDQIPFDNKNLTISRGMKDVIRKLLKKSPLDRISYEEFFADPVVTGDIPGLHLEDVEPAPKPPPNDPQISGPSRRLSKQAVDASTSPRPSLDPQIQPRGSEEEVPRRASRQPSDPDLQPRKAEFMERRKSSAGPPESLSSQPPPSQRQPRRPSIIAHVTAPAREGLHGGQGPLSTGQRIERRSSRTSPLAGPPMIREPTDVEPETVRAKAAVRAAKEKTAQDIAFEKEYVMIEKRSVEVNAFADELQANAQGQGSPYHQGAMIRRTTTQGQPPSVTGAHPTSPSRGLQMVTGRSPAMHQRGGSFERRYAPTPQSATNMLTKALNAANVRIFGALGTSPPFGRGLSPPHGYGAFPTYPTPQGQLLLAEGTDSKSPVDEDTRMLRTMEEAAHRSDVIYGFAEVKYKQLIPAVPSSADPLGIQQIGAREKPTGTDDDDEAEDKDMTTAAIVGVAEEALVLYVKTLAILAKTIDLAGFWWHKQSRGEVIAPDPSSKPPTSGANQEMGKRMNNVVQWSRNRFNECLEKSEVVGRRLQHAQRQLPADHPAHPDNHATASGSAGAITTSAETIQITSGVTAERLMFERAVEMSRAAAVSELVNDELLDCEIGYITAIMLLEAVLEADDEPLMRRPSAKKDKAADGVVNGMETEDRQTVVKRKTSSPTSEVETETNGIVVIDGARARLIALRKKIHAAQQQQSTKRSSFTGNLTPKPTSNPSPTTTPAVAGTPPR
ncbi:Serine/threonine-protein kinase [Friedmanniomyces endolithicus]|nr:Serine/threonine-protein kinase [Friedmanniomyces endolithicus]